MKALPDKTTDKGDADAVGAPGDRDPPAGAAFSYSSQSEAETAAEYGRGHRRGRRSRNESPEDGGGGDDDDDDDDDEDEENCAGRRHKSKKKHKKHHHHHHHHKHHDKEHEAAAAATGARKKHKKHKAHHKRVVEPIFLWAQNREAKIVRVVCEDYDPHNRLRLVKTGGVWTSNPRSKVLTAVKSRSSSRYGDDSQKDDTDDDEDDGRGRDETADGPGRLKAREPLSGDQVMQFVDLNDNSIEFANAVCGDGGVDLEDEEDADDDDDEDERLRQARIDRALEMIERDPTLTVADDHPKAPSVQAVRDPEPRPPPARAIDAAGLRLPEGTTIHQVKTEHAVAGKAAVAQAPPPPPPPPSVPLRPPPAVSPLQRCTFGELTIISQQDLDEQRLHVQQNEPLNLETACKRPALEIRLQEQPFKKKRVERAPQQRPPPQQHHQQQQHQHQHQQQQQQQQQQRQQQRHQPSQQLPPPPKSLPIGVKREWDPLSELKEVLSDPRLSVPDPLLVPKARLAALVASPATEIPKLLQQRPPDPDLLTVSLSHLQSILVHHADDQRAHGGKLAADGGHPQHGHHQTPSPAANIDQMLWLSYLSSCKDMAGADADFISSVLNLLLPPAHQAAPGQQPSYGGYTAQQQAQWNDLYYAAAAAGNLGVVPSYGGGGGGGGGTTAAGYSKSEDYCASPLLPPSQQQHQQPPPPPKHHHQQKPAAKQRGPEPQCCNGASPLPPQPSACYDMCCAKAGVCGGNPFAVPLSPAGCGVGGGGGNLKYAAAPDGGHSATGGAGTCCFPGDMGCAAYGYHQPPSPVSRKHHNTPSPARNRTPYPYQTGLGQHHQLLQQQLQAFPGEFGGGGGGGGSCGIGEIVDGLAGGNVTENVGCQDPPQQRCSAGTAELRTSPPPPQPAPSKPADGGASRPLQKAKIKVKQHLIDPNAKPKLLNIEGALHLAGANAHDLLTSPLWHPLFGSQEKRYGCRWQWTTPVTTSASTTSSDTSGTR